MWNLYRWYEDALDKQVTALLLYSIGSNMMTKSVLIKAFKGFIWKKITDTWRSKLQLCLKDPNWNTNTVKVVHGTYIGRKNEDRNQVIDDSFKKQRCTITANTVIT